MSGVNAAVVVNDINIKQGREGVHTQRIGSMAAGGSFVVLESTNPTTIEFLEWATNSLKAQIRISHRLINGSYEGLGILQSDGSNTIGMTPAAIVQHSSSLFIINSYDTGKYKFTLRNKMHFPNGVKIEISNNDTAAINNAVRLFGVKY